MKEVRNLRFNQGYACAVAVLIRNTGESTEARECLAANFGSMKALKNANLDPFDLEVLIPVMKEIERRNKTVTPCKTQ